MEQSKQKFLMRVLAILAVLMALSVLWGAFISLKKEKISPQEDELASPEKKKAYTSEELQRAISTPLSSEETVIYSEEEIGKAMARPLPADEVVTYSTEELLKSLDAPRSP